MITVTGATGALGGAVVDHLLTRVPASDLTVAVRDAARVAHLAARGVTVRGGADYADPVAMRAAFAGADTVLLVSSNDPFADTVALHRDAVAAAADVGVSRVVYTAHQGAAARSPFAPAVVHAATEEVLAASGVAWTSLRNGFYAHSLDWLAGPWRETGVVAVPADGPVSWTWRDDEAEAAAVVLAAGGGFDGPVTLTAAEAPTFAEVAVTAAAVTGRDVRCEVRDPDRWLADQVAAGTPEGRARFTLGMYEAAREGLFAGTDPLLARLLGRPPRSVRDLIAAGPAA